MTNHDPVPPLGPVGRSLLGSGTTGAARAMFETPAPQRILPTVDHSLLVTDQSPDRPQVTPTVLRADEVASSVGMRTQGLLEAIRVDPDLW